MRVLSALVLSLLLVSGPAWGQPSLTGAGGSYPVAAAGNACTGTYTAGPGDQVSFTAWWGFRAYTNAIFVACTQKLANVRNTSTAETCDLLVGANGGVGLTANCSGSSNNESMATFCGGNCAITKMYDQTGGGRDVSQGTGANQPALVQSCFNSMPCASSTSAVIALQAGSFTPATGVASFATVADRSSGTGLTRFLSETQGASTSNAIQTTASANTWNNQGGSAGYNFTASDATAHAVTTVINGASSVAAVDGTETSGTATGTTTAGATTFIKSSVSSTIEEAEAGFLDNSAFSSTIRTNLCHNMRLYYATSGSC